jgi:hypothetical protein
MLFRSLSMILIIAASLSLAAIDIIPIYHQATAKQCNDNNDDGSDSSSCSNKQDSSSNNHKHTNDGNSAKKQITPFFLAVPFP